MWILFAALFAANVVIGIARYLTKPSTMVVGNGRAFVGSRQMFAVCVLALLWAGFSRAAYAADLSAAEILGKVSNTYNNLKICRFIALESSEVDSFGTSRSQNAVGGETPTQSGIATPDFYNYGKTRVEITAVMPGKIRVEAKYGRHDGVLVSDSQKTWTYLPKAKEYKEVPGGISAGTDRLTERLADYWRLLVGRFQYVSEVAASATREEDATVEVGRDKVECYVVKIQTQEAMDKLWVDMNRFLVLRFEQIPTSFRLGRPNLPSQMIVTVNMVEADLNANLEDSLFGFTALKGWRKVSHFEPSVE